MPDNNISLRFGVNGLSTVLGAFGQISGKVLGLGTVLKSVTAIAAGGLSIAALGHLTHTAIETADAMGRLAQSAGGAVTDISGLVAIGKRANVEQGELRMALKELGEEMVRTGRGSESLTD